MIKDQLDLITWGMWERLRDDGQDSLDTREQV